MPTPVGDRDLCRRFAPRVVIPDGEAVVHKAPPPQFGRALAFADSESAGPHNHAAHGRSCHRDAVGRLVLRAAC
jgi:hypothetical protein